MEFCTAPLKLEKGILAKNNVSSQLTQVEMTQTEVQTEHTQIGILPRLTNIMLSMMAHSCETQMHQMRTESERYKHHPACYI